MSESGEGDRRDQDAKNDALFVNLIMIFQGAAMQQLGKMPSPISGKIERNLEQARFSIDTLAMLREKTRGNLSGDLERLLDSVLMNLRLNFVDEGAKEPEAPPGGGGTGAGGEGARGARGSEEEGAGRERPDGTTPAAGEAHAGPGESPAPGAGERSPRGTGPGTRSTEPGAKKGPGRGRQK